MNYGAQGLCRCVEAHDRVPLTGIAGTWRCRTNIRYIIDGRGQLDAAVSQSDRDGEATPAAPAFTS